MDATKEELLQETVRRALIRKEEHDILLGHPEGAFGYVAPSVKLAAYSNNAHASYVLNWFVKNKPESLDPSTLMSLESATRSHFGPYFNPVGFGEAKKVLEGITHDLYAWAPPTQQCSQLMLPTEIAAKFAVLENGRGHKDVAALLDPKYEDSEHTFDYKMIIGRALRYQPDSVWTRPELINFVDDAANFQFDEQAFDLACVGIDKLITVLMAEAQQQ